MTTEPDDVVDAEIVEMTPAEEEWVTWSMSSDVDTGGYCSCGHEGLGVSWHLDNCRGAAYALRNKVTALMAANHDLHDARRMLGTANMALVEAIDGDVDALADRLAAGNPYSPHDPGRYGHRTGYDRAVSTLRAMATPPEPTDGEPS